MTRMIDKIAAAIEIADEEGIHPIEGHGWSLAMARAAVEAMMEPTAEMSDAGVMTFVYDDRPAGQPHRAWKAMLRTILDEEE